MIRFLKRKRAERKQMLSMIETGHRMGAASWINALNFEVLAILTSTYPLRQNVFPIPLPYEGQDILIERDQLLLPTGPNMLVFTEITKGIFWAHPFPEGTNSNIINFRNKMSRGDMSLLWCRIHPDDDYKIFEWELYKVLVTTKKNLLDDCLVGFWSETQKAYQAMSLQ